MKLFDSWDDFCKYMDFKGYFLDMLIGLIYWGLVLGVGLFWGAYQYGQGRKTLAILLWIFGGLLLISMLLGTMAAIPVWYRKRRNGGGDDEM